MRVGMDISQTAHPGGVATYTQNLAEELSKIPGLEMIYFYSSLRKPYQGNLKNVKIAHLPPTLFEVLFNRIRNIGIEKFLGLIDVFHSSDWVQPPTKAKKVTTYHDVVPLKYPQWSDPKVVSVAKRRLKIVEKEIDCVIAVSEATKKDLLEISKIPEEKIAVVYEGVNAQFQPQSSKGIADFKKSMNLPEKFILAIGGIGERRNLPAVKKAAQEFNLIITGENLWVEQKDLPLLYSAASLLLYPSFYEGFGLPILEAMACGVPVITSNISAMPEIAGDAAILVDPKDVTEISKKVKEVMEDQKVRARLVEKGLARAKQFSWQKCAQQTAAVYQKLLV